MATPKLTKLEFQIMEIFWAGGDLSIREVLDAMPGKRRPAYTTIQTTVYRMEEKGFVSRVRKVGNVHLFAASISRKAAERKVIDDLLAIFRGRPQAVMARLVETGELSLKDVQEIERALRKLAAEEKQS